MPCALLVLVVVKFFILKDDLLDVALAHCADDFFLVLPVQ